MGKLIRKDLCIFSDLKKKINFSFSYCKKNLLEKTCAFFRFKRKLFSYCKRNSLEKTCAFFQILKKKFDFPIVRETHKKRLVHFFRFEKKNIFSFSYCKRNSLKKTCAFFHSILCNRKSLEKTCEFFQI